MTLENLVGLSLERVDADREAIQRLLEAAELSLTDARTPGLSSQGAFDLAYKAIMQAAHAALQANGYRTLTSRPGHHQVMIQSLPKSVGLDTNTMVLLDQLRKQRNVIDYSGDVVSNGMTRSCVAAAESLLDLVRGWLLRNRPNLS